LSCSMFHQAFRDDNINKINLLGGPFRFFGDTSSIISLSYLPNLLCDVWSSVEFYAAFHVKQENL
jgi:hypothetical protein